MTRVFIDITLECFVSIYKPLSAYIGEFQIEQSVEQSLNKIIRVWFYTDKVKIEEGNIRQVELTVTKIGDDFIIEMEKY